MKVICSNTGIQVGNKDCQYCTIRSCEGYKIVKEDKDQKSEQNLLNKIINHFTK